MRGLGAAIPHPFAKGAKGWGTQNSWDTCCSVCWFERLDAQQIGEDATLLGGEDTLISSGVEYRLALIQRDRAQVLESALHQRLSVHGQGDPAARGVVDAQPILGREMLEHLSTQDRLRINDSARRWVALPVDRQSLMKRAFKDLRSVPLDQRQTVLNSARYQGVFSPEERGILSDLLRVEPFEPAH